jgi:autotransporter-associated beta strand protein
VRSPPLARRFDNNTDAASFGTAGGTWAAPTSGWTTNAAGTAVPGSVTTATTDTLNFGTSSDGLAAGTITVSGTVGSGNITFGSASGAIVLSGGTITLAAAPTITVNNASNTINSVLAGTATTLTKAGSGTLILSGSNTYTGATTVNGGTLSITGSGAIYSNLAWSSRVVTVNNAVLEIDRWNGAGSLGENDYGSGNLVLNGGTLRYIGSETLTRADGNNARAFSLGAGGGTLESNATAGKEWVIALGNTLPSFSTTLTLAGSGNGYIGKVISGTGGAGGSLVKTGDGTWTLDAINTYTGATTVNEGTLELLKTASGSGTIRGVLNINAGGAVRSSVNNSLGYDNGIRVPTVNINGGTLIGGASKQLVFWGTTLNLTGGNVFIENGATFLFGGGGIDPLAAVNTLASANTTIFSGTDTAAISLQQANLTFDVADGTAATDLRISLPISGSGNGITKTGAGVMELSGVITKTGATNVSAGTLAVNGIGSINDSAVTVNGGTFRYNSSVAYSGALTYTSGTVGGTNLTGSLNNLTISSGQTLSPGNSPGTATTGSQTWAGGGTYDWEINDANATAGADPGWDLLSGTGTLTISATSGSQFNLNLYSLSLLNVAGSLTDFNNANSYNWLIADFAAVSGFSANAFNVIDTNFSNNNTLNGTFGVALGDTVLGGDNSQIYLTYTSIPEPRAALLGGLGLLALLRRRR